MLQGHEGSGRAAPPRQPIFNIPWPIVATLAALLGVQAVREVIPEGWDDVLFLHLAFVPGRFTYAVAPDRMIDALSAMAARGGAALRQAQAERWLLLNTGFDPWTGVTYAALHADWAHVGLNGVWLLAFGTPVARRFRPARFFAFLVAGALAGALAQWCCQPTEFAPVIGASAAVSGCMGAALRFMFGPRAPMEAPAGTSGGGGSSFRLPPQTLHQLVRDTRALTFLVAWFATNLLFGLGPISLGFGGGPIAWQAHIGGFAVGLLMFRLFDPVRAPALAGAPRAAPADPTPGEP